VKGERHLPHASPQTWTAKVHDVTSSSVELSLNQCPAGSTAGKRVKQGCVRALYVRLQESCNYQCPAGPLGKRVKGETGLCQYFVSKASVKLH
jgi:hypothetical protein